MSIVQKIMFRSIVILVVLILVAPSTLSAQLDSVHFVPPMHARGEYGPQYLYITTPEPLPFPVTIKTANGTLVSTLNISNSTPQRYFIGSTDNTNTLVPENSLHQALTGYGLIVQGEKKFYVNFRAHSTSSYQACDLTCKGLAALGTTFRTGQMIQGANEGNGRSNFIGIIAVEDSTAIQLSEYDPSVRFRINGANTLVQNSVQLLLNKGQSCVISQYVSNSASAQPPNGMIGSLLTSSKPIAVNVGSWTGAPVTEGANDIGIDQIVPVELVGEEYILCKGNGGNIIEIPYVVAHENGTAVYLNGAATPVVTLNAGEYYRILTNQFTTAGNLHVLTSKPAYMYQVIGGVANTDDEKRTGGLIFVPPISCSIPNAVDNIYQPNQIGSITYDGGLMIVAMRDSAVTVRVDGTVVSIGNPDDVQGNPDFVTYRRLNLFDGNNPPETVSVVAEGAVQVAYFGRNGAAGFGGFFSGFSKVAKPDIALQIIGDGVCPDTLVASGRFDGVQWYYADSLLQYGPDSFFVAYAPGLYTARGYLGVCRRTDYAEDTLTAQFNSPQFPYTTTPPSCFGFSDGGIEFGTPYGGLEPYRYSVDNGFSFTQNNNINNLKSGIYKLVVKDSTGCYNYPIELFIGQPDSLGVAAEILRIEEPVDPGESVLLGATPTRPVEWYAWSTDSIQCANCTTVTAMPQQSTWYTVTVTDDMGCTATDRVQIAVQPAIFAPNVFHPNDPTGGNERFWLFSKEDVPVNWLRIYDRWGNLVFETQNTLTNDRYKGWDGTFRDKDAQTGVYVFVAELEHVPGRRFLVKGDVTLLR